MLVQIRKEKKDLEEKLKAESQRAASLEAELESNKKQTDKLVFEYTFQF